MILGSHVSFSNEQILGSVKETISYGANAFMFYTGAPHNTIRKEINLKYLEEAKKLMEENKIAPSSIICHAPYIINLANNLDETKYEFSKQFLRKEIERCLTLGVKYIVLHPGSAVSIPRHIAINNIIDALNDILKADDDICILLETMAGKGTEIGINLDELNTIIKNINLNDKIGVCLDTCHLSDSGVDISHFDKYLEAFEKIIGIQKIHCVHLNDSKNPVGSHKDRHENIGFGNIGFSSLLAVLNNPKLKDVPKILETPYINEKAPYKEEIQMLKDQTFNPNLKELF